MDENSEASVGQAPVSAELDTARARLKEINDQAAAFGGHTPADRNLVKAQEAKIAGLNETIQAPATPAPVEAVPAPTQKEGFGRRVLSAFKNFRTRSLKPQAS